MEECYLQTLSSNKKGCQMKNPFKVRDPRDFSGQIETHSVPRKPKHRKRRDNMRVDKAFDDQEFLQEMTDRDDEEGYGD